MKLPRIECRACGRHIAAGPVAGRLGKGRVWRHDPPGPTRTPGGPLISCPGSLDVVDLPQPATQLLLPDGQDATGQPADLPDSIDTLPLF